MTEENFADYKLGYKSIDNDHWELIRLMESAKLACLENDKNALIAVADKLEKELPLHFKHENCNNFILRFINKLSLFSIS